MEKTRYYSGTSGLLLPVPNKAFYPEAFQERSRLHYYASMRNSIEINSSFYKIPQSQTIKKWADDVPANFRFTFKLFKGITHQPGLAFDAHELAHFMQVVSNVGEKSGCILVQFPPSIRIAQLPAIQRLLSALKTSDPDCKWPIAIEFRHPSLYVADVYAMLEDGGFAMVIHDKGISTSPFENKGAGPVYIRFHGPEGNYRGSYESDVLYEYAGYIRDWLAEGKSVYVYFNNTMGNVHANLELLNQFVSSD
ncbi:DUF72 domain-containing protein [Pedobacter sandarakinus]|uniref:DUF72 domain-containing protein n=1 Tax=Pedobacter sandarakinus TaxID=353156 RepID=UPI002245A9CB|nr:DUF72 domain-containing protein [Pedobacter sandarakinus]MCX2574081.1 DUF72 domain-containing protein [Pedobacter sandarakinus]